MQQLRAVCNLRLNNGCEGPSLIPYAVHTVQLNHLLNLHVPRGTQQFLLTT